MKFLWLLVTAQAVRLLARQPDATAVMQSAVSQSPETTAAVDAAAAAAVDAINAAASDFKASVAAATASTAAPDAAVAEAPAPDAAVAVAPAPDAAYPTTEAAYSPPVEPAAAAYPNDAAFSPLVSSAGIPPAAPYPTAVTVPSYPAGEMYSPADATHATHVHQATPIHEEHVYPNGTGNDTSYPVPSYPNPAGYPIPTGAGYPYPYPAEKGGDPSTEIEKTSSVPAVPPPITLDFCGDVPNKGVPHACYVWTDSLVRCYAGCDPPGADPALMDFGGCVSSCAPPMWGGETEMGGICGFDDGSVSDICDKSVEMYTSHVTFGQPGSGCQMKRYPAEWYPCFDEMVLGKDLAAMAAEQAAIAAAAEKARVDAANATATAAFLQTEKPSLLRK